MAIIFFCLPLAALQAQTLSGGETLTEPIGVRQLGMGETGTGLSGDVHSLFYNPSGLADLACPEVDTMYSSGLFENQTAQIIAGMPTPWLGSGSLAVACLAELGPTMEINNLDGSTESVASQKDFVFSAAYGRQLSQRLNAGVTLKLLNSTLVEQYTATAVDADLGLLYKDFFPGVNLGLALQNLGTPIRYLDQSDPSPTIFRAGLGYETSPSPNYGFKAGLDLLFPNDSNPLTNLGLEYNWQKIFFLRGGYKFGYALDSFTLGAGFIFNNLRLDYAFSKMAVGTDLHRFGLGYMFGTAGTAPAN